MGNRFQVIRMISHEYCSTVLVKRLQSSWYFSFTDRCTWVFFNFKFLLSLTGKNFALFICFQNLNKWKNGELLSMNRNSCATTQRHYWILQFPFWHFHYDFSTCPDFILTHGDELSLIWIVAPNNFRPGWIIAEPNYSIQPYAPKDSVDLCVWSEGIEVSCVCIEFYYYKLK